MLNINNQSWGYMLGSVKEYTIYDPPTVTSLSPQSGPTTGSTEVDVYGYFYNTGVVEMMIGPYNMTDCVFYNTSHVRCVTPEVPSISGTPTPLDIALRLDTIDVLQREFSAASTRTFVFYNNPHFQYFLTRSFIADKEGTMVILGDGFEVIDYYPHHFEPKIRVRDQQGGYHTEVQSSSTITAIIHFLTFIFRLL